jgi:hypothetical protein
VAGSTKTQKRDVLVRDVPAALLDALDALGERSRRSRTQEIIWALEGYVAESRKNKKIS